MPWVPLVFLAVAGLAVIAFVYAQRVAELKRVEDLRALAPTLGFSLEPASRKLGESGLDAGLVALTSFKRGPTARVRNVMSARRRDGEEVVFDFRYTVSTGQSSHTIEQTVLAVGRRGAGVPAFRLHPEGAMQRLAQKFGAADIDFDSNDAFSRSYVLTGEDADAVRAFFERHAVVYFADQPGWSAEGASEWVILFRAGKRVKVNDLSAWLDEARRAARVFDSR
jgi:hypothetical protein